MARRDESAQGYSIPRLRRSGVVFLIGKGLTAPINLSIFLLIAAHLSKPEFALYAWLIALSGLSRQLSYCGVNWVALHYVPYYRTRVAERSYRLFLVGLVAVRFALIGVLIAAYFVTAPHLVAAFGYAIWLFPLRLYLAVMAAELGVEFLRSSIFEPLLEQGVSQGNVLLQHTVFLTGLLLLLWSGGSSLSIEDVIYAKAAAVWLALLVALGQFGYLLRQPAAAVPSEPPIHARVLLGFALDNYVQDVMRLTSSGPSMTMLASRLLDLPALATFGFAQNLTGFVDRFLPAQLFLGLLRPRVIATYVDDRSFGDLQRRIGLILKISSCALAVATALLVAVGSSALSLLAGGQYAGSYGLLLTFLLWLAIISVQRMQAVLTNVLGHSEVLRRAASVSLLVVPTAVVLIHAGAGPYGLVLGMIVGEAVSVWLVSNQLRRAGYRWRFDLRGYGRLAAAAVAAAILGRMPQLTLPAGFWAAGIGVALTLVSFVLALRLLRSFSLEERRAIESLFGRRTVLL